MTYFGSRIAGTPDPKPEKTQKKRVPYRYVKKPTGERELFAKIWSERPHRCQITGEPIHDPQPWNFMHVLPKAQNKYPKFILNPQNILLVTQDCHHLWDHGLRDRIRHDARWFWVFELEISLKEQYKKLHPGK